MMCNTNCQSKEERSDKILVIERTKEDRKAYLLAQAVRASLKASMAPTKVKYCFDTGIRIHQKFIDVGHH